MRLGKVVFNLYYVVDLDDECMVGRAKDMILEDLEYATKFGEEMSYIDVVDADVQYPNLTESDIHPALIEDCIGE